MAQPRFAWCAPDKPGVEDDRARPPLALTALDLAPWRKQLQSGEVVSFHLRDLDEKQRLAFAEHPFQSALFIPIVVEGSWWGSLKLASCDIERDWTEAERDSLRAAADMLGAAITRQRTQDALVRAKEAAEMASRAKSQFLANMSHEIRTPITGVLGMLDLLRRTSLDDKQRRYVSHTQASAGTLLTVIGDVLDFSKIEAGKLKLEESTFSVADVLDVALRLLAEKAESKGLELACRMAPDVPRLLVGDPDRLRQVLLNLLSNAVKFTDRGSVVATCSRVVGPEATTMLRFEVRDTGIGIPQAQQALVFNSFYQADNSMSRSHGGTGLGLTICRQLVGFMGGQLGVESVPGQGSTFWFTARFQPAPLAEGPPATRRLVDLRGLRVLVVDDCAVVRGIVCDQVRVWNGVPEQAPEATTGLERLRQAAARGEPFDVAVIDSQMPGLDGLAMARLIQQEASLRTTALVLLSGFTQAALAPDYASAGFLAWLSKPARQSELYDAILTAANRWLRPARQEPPGMPRPLAAPVAGNGSGTVLLAEDNEINHEVVSEMLTTMGYVCTRVRTGREAVASVQQGQPDLVLMDCQMPELDGYEATRLIRRWEQHEAPGHRRGRRVPILALTAHAMKGDRALCLEAGMDDYLTKPLDRKPWPRLWTTGSGRLRLPGHQPPQPRRPLRARVNLRRASTTPACCDAAWANTSWLDAWFVSSSPKPTLTCWNWRRPCANKTGRA